MKRTILVLLLAAPMFAQSNPSVNQCRKDRAAVDRASLKQFAGLTADELRAKLIEMAVCADVDRAHNVSSKYAPYQFYETGLRYTYEARIFRFMSDNHLWDEFASWDESFKSDAANNLGYAPALPGRSF